MNNIPTHDVSGTSFIAGITQFTADNYLGCIEKFTEEGHCTWNSTKLVTHPAVFYRMLKNNLLDRYKGGYTFMTSVVVEHSDNCKKTGNVFSSHIVDKETGNLVGELITREA